MKRKQQTKARRLAELVCLSRVLDALALPIRTAEDWIRPADLVEFVEELDQRVHAVVGLIDSYLAKHPEALGREDNREDARIVELELAEARKCLKLIDRLRGVKNRANPDFSAEIEELRALRAGELKPSASKVSSR